MDYTPPVGGAANDPYVDANPGIGQAGSAVPAAAIEDPQREIVNAITSAGLVPTDANLTQLAAAIIALAKVSGLPTGVLFPYSGLTAPAGFLLCLGTTIGNALSGATERANADTENLFVHLWDSFTDAEATVSGGRGSSGVLDFGADKTITLPDAKGRGFIGSGAGTDTAEGGGAGTARTHGGKGGAETHTLTVAELAAHKHLTVANQTTNSSLTGSNQVARANSLSSSAQYTLNGSGSAASLGLSESVGGGAAHNNMPPWLAMNVIIKL